MLGDNVPEKREEANEKEPCEEASSSPTSHVSVQVQEREKARCVLEPFDGEPRLPVTVRVAGIEFTAKVSKTSKKVQNVATATRDALNLCKRATREDLHILKNLSLTLRAGTSTLILGAPGSGKTSLLKLLAGRLRVDKAATLKGEVTYNGVAQSSLHMAKVATYVGQLDEHLALQTVRDIFGFAQDTVGSAQAFTNTNRCEGNATDDEIHEALAPAVDDMLDVLGLTGAADTIIGNELFRGVSGGERRRTTLGEMLFGRHPLLLLDEISTGLDSATTFKLVQALCASTRRMQSNVVISLLQPGPEVIELFDDVLMMSEGQIIYHGPVQSVLQHFEALGFVCRPGRSLGEFLADMTTPRRNRYFAGTQGPIGIARLAAQSIPAADTVAVGGETVSAEDAPVSAYYLKSSPDHKGKGSPFVLDAWSDFKVVCRHVSRTYWRDRIIYILLVMRGIFISGLVGWIFFQLPTTPENDNSSDISWLRNRLAVTFFAIFLYSTSSFEVLPFVLATRDVLHKQLDAKMLRPSSYVISDTLAMCVANIPEAFCVASLAFWMTNLVDSSAADVMETYGLFLAINFAAIFVCNTMTRAIAYSMPNLVVAFMMHAVILPGACYFFGGFIITESTIPDWLIWFYWISPVSYLFRAATIIILDSDTFADRTDIALELWGVRPERYWIWVAILYSLFIGVLCMVLQWAALRFVRFTGHRGRREGSDSGLGDESEDEGERDATVVDDVEKAAAVQVQPSSRALAGAAKLATSMPCPQVDFTFRDISYAVKVKGAKAPKMLLTKVTGHVRSGRMCAIIGATGAGKTTLLNQISLRKTSGQSTGDLLLNGRLVTDTRMYQRLLGFCEQEDYHCAFSTVREAALFSARLRLPAGTSTSEAEVFVDAVLETLDLAGIANDKIGVKGHGGLSVGQFKRLTVAVELAANPAILFLDEPTSGLDATAAEVTMRAVKRVCTAGRTVLCTIHQPSREVFALFDDILLLQKGGRVAYHGPVAKMVSYFSRYEVNTVPVPAGDFNPSNYALDVLALGQGVHASSSSSSSSSSAASVASEEGEDSADTEQMGEESTGVNQTRVDWAVLYHDSPEHAALEDDIAAVVEGSAQVSNDPAQAIKPKVSTMVTTLALWRRWGRAFWRSLEVTVARLLAMVILLFLFSLTLVGQTSLDTVAETQSYVGALYYCLILASFLVALATMDLMYKSRGVFYREKYNHIYSTAAYASGSMIMEIISLIVTAVVSVIPLYFIMGLRTDFEGFVGLASIFFANFVVFSFMSNMFIASTPNIRVALFLIVMVISFFILFASFLISRSDAAPSLQWLFPLSPLYFVIQGMMQSQLRCDCAVDANLNAAAITCNGGLACEDVCSASLPGCSVLNVVLSADARTQVTAWQYVSTNFEVPDETFAYNFGYALLFAVVFKLGEYFALRRLTFGRA
ncbi:ABC transporter G family member 31 [Hondaea fermentalgiana]|uniref:ABC transporter G family member 31 n=1 Tax=Hondaea fermentalgiana TaxID=2315210 RepID=A0A2R5GW83_9STRA|nr:ABC transporter G family member 31 [Hondaea fermentalgiana]|eukprot:GBG34028.1 ABC transporter G family member 31 [Hondaea fermentalgiana]